MNRFKFRAWDGNKIRYDITGFEHGFKNEMDGVFIDGDYYSMRKDSMTSKLDERHAAVMQWTGLTDKNGVDIYEGDIVSDYGHINKIIFSHGCFCLSNAMMHYEGTYWSTEYMEVLGNIYENPELLEGGK